MGVVLAGLIVGASLAHAGTDALLLCSVIPGWRPLLVAAAAGGFWLVNQHFHLRLQKSAETPE